MRKIGAAGLLLCAALFCMPLAQAAEGDPLLGVDDLVTLEDSYEAFLGELEALIVSRGLLSEEERAAWHDAQMGDFYQNGGYGSILANYTPGILSYAREEETVLTLRTPMLSGGTLELLTMRRYTPQDSSLSGLMLTLTMLDAQGTPVEAVYTLRSSSGIFLKWDALLGAYINVGIAASSEGETVVWSDQTPAQGAQNPVITVSVVSAQTQELLGEVTLTLTVSDTGYLVADDALAAVAQVPEAEK